MLVTLEKCLFSILSYIFLSVGKSAEAILPFPTEKASSLKEQKRKSDIKINLEVHLERKLESRAVMGE